jgi:uncharacterized membrane protein
VLASDSDVPTVTSEAADTRRAWLRTVRGLPSASLSWLAHRTIWQVLLFLAISVYTAYFTAVSLRIHHGLGTSSYDFGLYDQGLWLASRGRAPFVDLMGRNLFGDHASFILILVVPLYWLFPAAGTLFFTQSLAIGLGALPIFLFARKRLQSEAMALVLAVSYLLHPAVGFTNRENFHPDGYIAVLFGVAVYAALERKWRLYGVFVLLSLMVKEDVSLVVIPLGVWVAIRRDWRYGVATILGSISMAIFGMFVVMRSLIGVPTRNGWRIPFGGVGGFLRESVERPGNVFDHLRSDGRPMYLWQMAFPTAFVWARRADVALISALVLLTNIVSTYWYQYQIEYHYALVAVPALMIGTVYGVAALPVAWRRKATAAVAVCSVWACLMWGAVPIAKAVWPPHWGWDQQSPFVGREMSYSWPPDHPSAEAARELFPLIPREANVSAFHAVTAHLAHRDEIYQFPNPWRVVLYGPNDDLERVRACIPAANEIEYVMLPVAMDQQMQDDWNAVAADFDTVAVNEWWTLSVRSGDTVQCRFDESVGYHQLTRSD